MTIALSQPATLNVGGAPVEMDASAALVYLELTVPSTVRLFFSFGNVDQSNNFTAGQEIPRVVVTVDLTTGNWTSTNGLSGTLPGQVLASMQQTVATVQSNSETLVTLTGTIVGTAGPVQQQVKIG